MKDKKALLILIPFLLFVIIVGALAIVGDRIPDNPPETVGNTAGNLNNSGYFCEYDGTVYFANAYDSNTLYSMDPSEQNIKKLPFYTDVTNVILYHHENADGTGPFRKKWEEIPLFARIIHLCDTIDIIGNTGGYDQQNWEQAKAYLVKYENTIFDAECVKAFLEVFSEEKFADMGGEELEKRLWEKVPRKKQFCDEKTCKDLADFFAQIVDYKSEFTGMHSIGVAKKAAALAEHLGYDRLDIQKIYLAGALHDIGKMAIGNEILEKPGRLTDEEFSKMKNHAGYTYMILSEVEDFEEIRDWAALHHEKLDGSGYPFGKTAEELNEPERILACVDIYQALTEDRPYKKGMTHEQACGILEDMAQKGWIDAKITGQVRECFGEIH